MRSFSAKIQIFFKVGRIKKYDEGRVFFQKKNIIIFQKLSSQNGKAENMQMVAGRVLEYSIQVFHFLK